MDRPLGDLVVLDRHHPARVVDVLGAAWLDAIRRALGEGESLSDVASTVEQVTYAAEVELYGLELDDDEDIPF